MYNSMRTRKGWLLGVGVAITTIVVLAGCSTDDTTPEDDTSDTNTPSETGDTAETSDTSDLTVSMVTPESTGEFYGAMYCGARAAADEQGVNLNIQGSPETSVEAEMIVLQSVLATNPDGMLLTVWDNSAFNEIMSGYTDTGKPLVMVDSFLSNDAYIQSIRTDSYQSSYDAALQMLEDFSITSGKALVVTDSPGNQIQSARAEGFRDALQENSALEVLEFQYIGSDSAKASQTVSSALAANPDLALVFSTNIGAGTGAANGIRTAGAEDTILLGYDVAAVQVEELRSGDYDALVAQSPYEMGYQAMTLISEILKGETAVEDVTELTVYSPWALVTPENVDDPDIATYLYTTDCASLG